MNKKSVYKTITWRVLSMILGFSITYVYLGSIQTATMLTILHNIFATVLYYYHEMFYRFLRKQGKI